MPLSRTFVSVLGTVLGAGFAAAIAGPLHAAQRSQPPPVTTVAPVPPPATRLEDLLTRPGALVTRDLYRVSDQLAVNFGLVIDAVIATEVVPTAGRLQGLRVEVSVSGPPDRTRTSYVDLSELAGLSQAIGQMMTVASLWTGREDSHSMEAQFATVGGFVVGFHQDVRSQQAFVAAGPVDPARRTCNVQDFAIIKTAIDDAIALLKNK
jgi:hypothetical protein